MPSSSFPLQPAPAPESPFFTVIVVNWNGGAHLLTSLEHLERQTFAGFEAIVVDNGSEDGSADEVEARFPGYRLLRQDRNLGFAAANNLAAATARGEWLVLLNNDAFAEPDWLEALHAGIGENPAMSGFASCQLQARHPEKLDGAGDTYHAIGVPWRAGFDQPYGPPWDQPREIFVPCAAAAAYRRRDFLAVGGFDEQFFCYIEDVDLAFRLQLLGHRFMYWPRAVVRHVGSATTGKTSDFARYYGHRNMVWCYLKNMPGPLLWRTLPGHLALNAISLALFSLRGEGAPIWRAKRDALAGLPRVLRERRAIQASRTAAPRDLDKRMAHGWKRLFLRSRASL